MARAKKDSTNISIRFDNEILGRLNEYCEETGRTRTFVIEKSVFEYLERAEIEKQQLQALREQQK